jgi:uncharacterized protein (DUF302 family)
MAVATIALALSSAAWAADGLVTVASSYSAKETIDRLEAVLKGGGATIIARVDHAAGAASVNLPLRPAELLIFGNPKGGTPLMQLQQTMGIDLPLKALAFEDQAGKVWVSYNDPAWLAARHGIAADGAKVTDAMAAALKGAVATATTK